MTSTEPDPPRGAPGRHPGVTGYICCAFHEEKTECHRGIIASPSPALALCSSTAFVPTSLLRRCLQELKKCRLGWWWWRSSLAVKGTNHSSRRPTFKSRHPHGPFITICNSRGSDALFWPPWLLHARDTQTYIQTPIYIPKKKERKKCRWASGTLQSSYFETKASTTWDQSYFVP